jgi:hypothetical protein
MEARERGGREGKGLKGSGIRDKTFNTLWSISFRYFHSTYQREVVQLPRMGQFTTIPSLTMLP